MSIKDVSSMSPAEAIAYLHGMADGILQTIDLTEIFHEALSAALDKELVSADGSTEAAATLIGSINTLDSLISSFQHFNNELARLIQENDLDARP